MKKHDTWTALSSFRPNTDATNHPMLSVLLHLAPKTYYKPTLLHLLLALLTETLLPIIPSIDGAHHHPLSCILITRATPSNSVYLRTHGGTDYNCLICTSIAYIPIRLSCTHIFCVRCLVKVSFRAYPNSPPVYICQIWPDAETWARRMPFMPCTNRSPCKSSYVFLITYCPIVIIEFLTENL